MVSAVSSARNRNVCLGSSRSITKVKAKIIFLILYFTVFKLKETPSQREIQHVGMPKKSFKTNTSTVFVKRKRNCPIIKKNNLDKQCSKFILIDGNNEKNWKTLKTELGCKTDTSFLEYLLALAQKDLDSIRGKKVISGAENENKVKVLVVKNSLKNIKKLIVEDDRLEGTENELEKEKEKEDLVDDPSSLFEVNKTGFKLDVGKGDPEGNEISLSYDCKKWNRKSRGSEDFKSKSKLTDSSSQDLAQKTKTDFAKDLVLENNSIEISKSLENRNRRSVQDVEMETNSDRKGDGSCRPDNKSRVKKEEDFFKLEKNRPKGKTVRRIKRKRKEKVTESESKSKEPSDGLGLAIKIKMCLGCKTRHVVGECRSEENRRREDPFENSYDSDFEKNSGKNVYDFDETEKKHGPEIPSSEDGKGEDSPEMKGGTDGYGSDSGSDSETKLRIDESFGDNGSFSEFSLPDYLELRISDEEHGPSVFTRVFLRKGTEFGPLVGEKIKEKDIPDDFDMKHIWEVDRGGGHATYISTRDAQRSNWLRYLRPGSSKESANLIGRTKEGSLVFGLTGDVEAGRELLYWTDDTHSAWSKKKMEKKSCGGCNLRFNHPLYYRKHCMIFHDPSCSLTIRKYHCKVCGVPVLGKEKIMKHAREMHQGRGAYQCRFCLKFFLRLNYLEMHRTYGCSKNPQRTRPLCDLCGRKFCQPQKLKVHIKRMHSDMAQVLKDFQCKSCLKILGSRAALQRHMKEVHSKDIVGASTCDRCGKMFQNKSNLKIHMLTHSGVKPFRCQQADCSAAFTTKQCLQFHYKKVHGFSDGFIPKIERSIAYTFDAYSGGPVPNRDGSSPRSSEDRNRSPSPSPTPISGKVCGLDLSLVLPSTQDFGGSKCRSSVTDNPESSRSEEIRSDPSKRENRGEPSSPERSPSGSSSDERSLLEPTTVTSTETKIIASKGSKKWMGPDEPSGFKPIFKTENFDASLLVEAAISAAEKDVVPSRYEKEPGVSTEEAIPSPRASTVGNPYPEDDSTGTTVYQEKVPSPDECYEKRLRESPVQSVKIFQSKSNFTDVLKSNALSRICPLNEMQKDYNVGREAETFNDIEIHDYPGREETYKENDSFHEQYRIHDFYRTDKTDYSEEFPPSSADKYRDANLEKYRSGDVYRLRNEIYDFGGTYRDPSEERDGQVQNLCLKEKSLQYETLEELARIGRDNPGFECLLVGDSSVNSNPTSLGFSRGLHGIQSPRSYHPAAYETESVDLSVPRPPYSSPAIYSLDLTRSRLHLPTGGDIDVTSHLGLSPHRFPNGRVSVAENGSSPVSPTDYTVYPSPYVTPARRPSPNSQFQPYTSLYY